LFTVILVGQVIVGNSVSFTTILKVQLEVPTGFVAVAVTVVVPTGKLVPGFWLYVIVEGGMPVVSVAAKVTVLLHRPGALLTVISAGQTIEGATPPTVTVKEHEAICPLKAVTVNVLVVRPMGKVEPLGRPAVCDVVAPGQLSVPVGVVYVATAPAGLVPVRLIFEGQVITGN
jgi:hypothetical protein